MARTNRVRIKCDRSPGALDGLGDRARRVGYTDRGRARERMNRDGFPGAVHAIGASGDSHEHAGRIASSRTFDIADHVGGGAVPGFKQEP